MFYSERICVSIEFEVKQCIHLFIGQLAIYDCNDNHEWKVCKCHSALSIRTRILSLWPSHYTSKYGKLDDSTRRKLPGCVV